MSRTHQLEAGRAVAKTHGSAPLRRAFTLIELLMVILVIALLAALIVPLTALAVAKMKISRVTVAMRDLETVIQNYKTTKGFYPPDNSTNAASPPLFYELNGTLADQTTPITYHPIYQTNIAILGTALQSPFGVQGFLNSTMNQAENPVFIHNFSKPEFVDSPNYPGFNLLICPVEKLDGNINPWNYISSNPTNNPNSFDLWVDIVVRGKTNRICNWSVKPVVL